MIAGEYTSRLGAGLGLIDETNVLLEIWQPEMSGSNLYDEALTSGAFPNISARRLRDVVTEGFAARYLVDNGRPASALKQLKNLMPSAEFRQLLLVFTARAHEILSDFVTRIYWPAYSAGKSEVDRKDSIDFVEQSNQDGMTTTFWSESTVRRVSSYLIGTCVDFGLLESGQNRSSFRISSFRIKSRPALVLSHDLHFSRLGDNALINHRDWKLFGLESSDVVEQLRLLSKDGHLVIQAAGGIANISWKYKDMHEVIDAISE